MVVLFPEKKCVPFNKKGKLSGLLQKNMVWQHFARKKNRFSEIVGKTK
jgi:hypothetical protein